MLLAQCNVCLFFSFPLFFGLQKVEGCSRTEIQSRYSFCYHQASACGVWWHTSQAFVLLPTIPPGDSHDKFFLITDFVFWEETFAPPDHYSVWDRSHLMGTGNGLLWSVRHPSEDKRSVWHSVEVEHPAEVPTVPPCRTWFCRSSTCRSSKPLTVPSNPS